MVKSLLVDIYILTYVGVLLVKVAFVSQEFHLEFTRKVYPWVLPLAYTWHEASHMVMRLFGLAI